MGVKTVHKGLLHIIGILILAKIVHSVSCPWYRANCKETKVEPETREPLEGELTVASCKTPKFKHLKSCKWANFNISYRYHDPTKSYTEKFLCKEKEKKKQKSEADNPVTRKRRSTRNPGLTNPCATASFADSLEVIEAKDDNGKYVELYHDVKREQFQTFYKRYCNKNFKLYGFECATIEVAFETAVWIDNGDEDITNDTVELRRVWIPLDCALHQKIF